MFQKKISLLVAAGIFAQLSLYAMDMDRVDAIAAQIKASLSGEAVVIKKEALKTHIKANRVEKIVIKPESHNTSAATTKIARISEESLGLRKTNLYAEKADTAPEATKYTSAAPGTSKRFDRAYENAPPMIPHSVDGLLPITKANNACLGCHMPDVAKSMGATPLPQTHFMDYRPATALKNGELVKEGKSVGPHGQLGNVSDIKLAKAKKLDHLYQGRYNCSQCHAPQSTQKPLVGNTFTPDFVTKDGAKKSHLIDTINEGVE